MSQSIQNSQQPMAIHQLSCFWTTKVYTCFKMSCAFITHGDNLALGMTKDKSNYWPKTGKLNTGNNKMKITKYNIPGTIPKYSWKIIDRSNTKMPSPLNFDILQSDKTPCIVDIYILFFFFLYFISKLFSGYNSHVVNNILFCFS